MRPAPPSRRTRLGLTALGMLSASVIAVNANLLAARFSQRWDWTRHHTYTLSATSHAILQGLSTPLTITILLSRNDPSAASIRQLLTTYREASALFEVRWVDPDRNPAEYLAIQQKFGLTAGKTDDGRLLSEACVIVTQAERHWFITSEELTRYNPETGNFSPALEQALTEGIAQVLDPEKLKVCFAIGHGELEFEGKPPNTLVELRRRLEKQNYEVLQVDLAGNTPSFQDCRTLFIVGPNRPFTALQVEPIAAYFRNGGSLLVAIGPAPDAQHLLQKSGLEPLLASVGVTLERNLVLETDPTLRLPRASGELFFALPQLHPITQNLIFEKSEQAYRILIHETQSLKIAPTGPAQPLLITSEQAHTLRDLSVLLNPEHRDPNLSTYPGQSVVVAAAAELPKPESSALGPPRLVVLGTASVLVANIFQDPALYANRIFIENCINWLNSRRPLVSLPPQSEQNQTLNLTEESLEDVLHYVLGYMPISALLLGGFVLARRRWVERHSRREVT